MYIFKSFTKTARTIALAIAVAGITSCAEELFERPDYGIECSDGQISVLYEVEGDIPLTRGIAASAHEKSLEHVYILYFDHSQSDKYVGYTLAGASEGTSTIKFDPPSHLQSGTQYRLLVVGNSNYYAGTSATSYAPFIKDLTGDYTTVRAQLLAEMEKAVTSDEPGHLPLCGRFVKQTTDEELYFTFNRTADGIEFPDANNSIFRFQRAICRVDIHNLVGNVLDIRYARLVNTRTKGSYFFDGLNQGSMKTATFKADAQSPGFVEMPAESNGQNLQRLEAELYCFPNTVNTCLPNDHTTTAVMLAGYYTDPETGEKDEVLTYYRFNVSNAGEAQSLQRNYCYRATLKGVNRRGEENEQDAYNATSPVFKYDIGEEWDTDDDNVVTDNEGNFLVVSKSLLTFRGEQQGADVVKLTVNTSDFMTWDIEMDPVSESKFQFKKIQEGPGEKIKAFTCGPKQINNSEFYYEGSLTIVAKNEQTGKELRKEVRLVQLTTNGDVKCLVVNDYTADFAQEVSKYGQTISFKVITGNPTNKWAAKDYKSVLDNWTDPITFTNSGTNGNYFTITFPANIGERRSVEIKFEFSCDDPNYNNEIKPIIVTFSQDACDQPLTIEGWPSDGVLELNCFDTTTGWETANCVAQSKRFTVHLQKPQDHYFTVESNFDKYRDLTLSEYNGKYGLGHEVRSFHPGLFYQVLGWSACQITDAISMDESQYNNVLTKSSASPSFYINAFRMGPGDPTIEDKIIVQVKDAKTNEDVPNGRLELTVRLVVPSDEYMINDVMIKNEWEGQSTNWADHGWIYIMDRNLGCDPRMHKVNDQTFPNKAMWCYYSQEEYNTDAWKITGVENNERWLGNITDYPIGNNNNSNGGTNNDINAWKNQISETHKHLGRMYENAQDYPWMAMTPLTLPSIKHNVAISKSRYFILSDEEVCPTNSKGEKIRVACWLPSGIKAGYGYHEDIGWAFRQNIVVLSNNPSFGEAGKYWPSATGNNTPITASEWLHLIRLMYMIGNKKVDSTNSLPESKINDEIEYYKNHILKCYEQ